ncbi:sorting nexin-like protein-41 [Venturia nashicola]|uniref:Sorting nexin-like protein-41 n=1 Tax=Venturia nashicola TaxID=86259 RepID=A0A4Z1NHX6_9PEZI|nr:sorting nexin-like protein-41 [Venturia nashicola]
MWDTEEDNNPYGSFTHRGSANSEAHPGSPGGFYNRPSTPPSDLGSPPRDSPDFISHPRDLHSLSDVDVGEEDQGQQYEPRKGGYSSRIEQILHERPDTQILITYAGKNSESGGNHIAYTIRTGVEVRRRYSEFASLRQTLVNLHPTLVIPPIPEKHTMADYAARPTKAKEDQGIIELRKRMLAVFLNRCRGMKEVLEDGVWWRFLDPNASWVLMNAHPVTSIPKNILKASPLDPANSKPGHAFLPVPPSSAKLRSSHGTTASGMPTSPPSSSGMPSAAAHTIPGAQLSRFPPSSQNLSEEALDPYFINFEASSKELEGLLQGSMEKSNRRLLSHYGSLAEDLSELGARYNGFSLSEQSSTLASAIEKIGQAVDQTYIATSELSSQLSATFAEPMRESAQFAGIVRNVLRYRVLKRVQEEMTQDELIKKRALLANLRDQEEQSQRMSATLSHYNASGRPGPRRISNASRGSSEQPRREDDVASIDSDFPPTHGDAIPPSAPQAEPTSPPMAHKKTQSGSFISNKIFGRITHAFHGIADSDPVKTRQDLIGKTSEQVKQLEQALEVSHDDVKDASSGVLKDLVRFQGEKEEDLKRYMIAFAKCHIDWARRNQASWEEAKAEVENIEVRDIQE